MRAMLCICRWLRVKRARSAASWARRPRRTAAGPRSTSLSTRTCSSTLRTTRARGLLGFTCWRDARASEHRRPRSPPLARSQWRNSRCVPFWCSGSGELWLELVPVRTSLKYRDARCYDEGCWLLFNCIQIWEMCVSTFFLLLITVLRSPCSVRSWFL